MKTKQDLEDIKNLVDSTYSKFGNKLNVNTDKPLNLKNPEFGYCYKDTIPDPVRGELYVYNIVCSKMGIPDSDNRIMMHEYGHIYLGHLDGIHEEYDTLICNVFRDHRGELIDQINKNCGIDFADKLIERVIDDPVLNHSLHNIAMDMEVNSKVIDLDDVNAIEKDASSVLEKYQEFELKKIANGNKELEKEIEDQIKKMKNEALIKFIHPSRYHHPDGTPFDNELSYLEYLILIIENLDQFVKMLVSIQNGGNGDTSQITSQDVKDTLDKMNNNGSQGMQSLDQLMQNMGMSDSGQNPSQGQSGNAQGSQGPQGSNQNPSNGTNTGKKGSAGKENSPYSGKRDDGSGNGSELNRDKDGKQPGGTHKDHMSDSRKKADEKRERHEIHSGGGFGCGSSHGSGEFRDVVRREDTVDMAIDEVIRNFKHKVIKHEARKDMMWNWNRGINRSVIAPSIKSKVVVSEEPKIVFLIDVSGSMDTDLIDRILSTISKKMRKIGRGLHYDVIAWDTDLCGEFKDIDPKKPIPRMPCGGGTSMAKGIRYFKEKYDPSAILILISDFEDYLEEWHQVELTMPKYTMYGFNYGYNSHRNSTQNFKYFKVKNFNAGSRNNY